MPGPDSRDQGPNSGARNGADKGVSSGFRTAGSVGRNKGNAIVAGNVDHGGIVLRAIVVMGVSGSGKSTLAALLADRLGGVFLEGDDFHSAQNVEKMRSGIALTDEDRWPWLDALGNAMRAVATGGQLVVVACSALRRCYRTRLASAAVAPIGFVLLDTGADELARRLGNRAGHYMPASLLDSQLRTLERPTPDECALLLDAAQPPEQLAGAVENWLAIARQRSA